MSIRRRRGALALLAAALGLALLVSGCSSTKHENRPVNVATLPVQTPDFPSATSVLTLPAPSSTSATASTSPSVSNHPVPSAPVRTATVDASGRHYVIQVWADVHNDTCFDHAYGQVATFLQQHPCRGLNRQLATTTVNGKPVGFALASLSIPGSDDQHLYDNAGAFRTLVEKDGTGSVNDLLREGYRLPSGPSSVPSPDAFRALAQDTGVAIFDVWYLTGPTPENDPALLQMTSDVYLQY